MGHSLGGLMVIHTLVHHKDLFNAYISIDAAAWWDDHKIVKEAKIALEKNNFENKKLFLAIANRMEKGIDTTAVQLDTSEKTELIRYNLDLIHDIKKHPKNKLQFNYKYYEKESHTTISFIAAYDALRYLFDYYEFPKFVKYTTDNPLLKTLIIQHYDTISKNLGYKVLPNKEFVNSLGYAALHYKKFELSKELFEMNVSNFPEDPNLMDSFGDYYNAIEDKKNAIKWYQKTLDLKEINETRQKMDALLKVKK